MSKIIVLGGGLVGRHIATDLSKDHEVTCVDYRYVAFFEDTEVEHIVSDVNEDSVPSLTEGFDIVVNALPGHLGFSVLKKLAILGKDTVDISFMPQDPTSLSDVFKNNGARAVVDIGVAPGLCGVWIGKESEGLPITRATIMVGGLPLEPKYPYYYKAPFSPIDVIEEYTRPVRMRKDGEDIIVDPFTDWQPIVGYPDLCAFNTDGCRTLLESFPDIPNMVEKTIRYKNHYNFMKALKDGGFFSTENAKNTAKVMLPHWKLEDEDKEFTLMRVLITKTNPIPKTAHAKNCNICNGTYSEYCSAYQPSHTVTYSLYDEWKDGVPSMARTTGYTCNAVVKLLADNKINEAGLYLPEDLGDHLDDITSYLADRDVQIVKGDQ